MPFRRIPCQDEETFRFPLSLTCLASPCRAGDTRSRPQAAKRWCGTHQPLCARKLLEADDADGNPKTRRHHADIMVRFEDELACGALRSS